MENTDISTLSSLSEAITQALNPSTTGPFNLTVTLPSVSLRQLVRATTSQELSLPSSFDVPLPAGTVRLAREGQGATCRLTTQADGLAAQFVARLATGTQGFAMGLALAPNAHLSLLVLEKARQLCHLDSLLVVVASYTDADFALSDLLAPDAPASQPLALGGGLHQGLTAYASWSLQATDPQQLLLRRLLHLPADGALAVLLHLDDTLTGGRLAVGTSFPINKLNFEGEFGCQIAPSAVELFLGGTLVVPIQGQQVTFTAELGFAPTGALIAGSMQGSVSPKLPFGHLTISDLALVVGVNWEGVPSLGLAGTLTVKDLQSSLAVFFDSSEPTKSMLAGSVSSLTLRKVLNTFAPGTPIPSELAPVLDTAQLVGTTDKLLPDADNKLATALAARSLTELAAALAAQGLPITSDLGQALLVAGSDGNSWFLTDKSAAPLMHYELTKQNGSLRVCLNPQFYFAPQDTTLGGLTFPQGLLLNGKLRFLAYEALVNIKASLGEGLLAEGYMSRIVIGTEAFFSIVAESDAQKGPYLSLATFSRPAGAAQNQVQAQAQALTQAQQTAQAALAQAQAAATAAQQNLGAAKTNYEQLSLRASLTHVPPQADQAKAAAAQALTQFNAAQPLVVAAAAALAQAQATADKLRAQAPAAATLPANQLQQPHFMLDGKVTILGMQRGIYANISKERVAFKLTNTLQLGVTCSLEGSFGGPSDLRVAGQLVVGLNGLSADLGPLGRLTLDTSVTGTLDLWVEPGPTPATVVPSAGFNEGQVQILGKTISLPTLILGVTSPSLQSLQQQLIAALVPELTKLFTDSKIWLDTLAKGLLTGAQDASQVLSQYYHQGKDQAVALLTTAKYTATQIAAGLKTAFGVSAPEEVARLLNQASYAADVVAQAMSRTYGTTKHDISLILSKGGYTADQVTGVLKGVFDVSAPEEAARLLNQASYAADVVTQTLGRTYGTTKDTISGVLNQGGYAAAQVTDVLKNAFGVSAPEEAAKLLNQASYAADVVTQALQGAAYTYAVNIPILNVTQNVAISKDNISLILNKAGYAADQVSGVLQGVFQVKLADAARLLRSAAYPASQVQAALQRVYQVDAGTVLSAFHDAGYGVSEVGLLLKNTISTDAGTIAKSLRTAGYGIGDIVSFLKDNLNLGFKDVGRALKAANYGKDDIKDILIKIFAIKGLSGLGELIDFLTSLFK